MRVNINRLVMEQWGNGASAHSGAHPAGARHAQRRARMGKAGGGVFTEGSKKGEDGKTATRLGRNAQPCVQRGEDAGRAGEARRASFDSHSGGLGGAARPHTDERPHWQPSSFFSRSTSSSSSLEPR